VKLDLDYTPETLPLLDHYLGQVPKDQPDTVRLVGACAGAYFGEICRKALGGRWDDREGQTPLEWSLELAGGVRLTPGGMALAAILVAESEEADDQFDVPPEALPAVEQALEARGEIEEDEYFTLSSRLEVLVLVVDTVQAATRRPPEAPAEPEPDDDPPN
jgi:hypothetical protein